MNRADKFWMWLAWRLPHRLVHWAAVRCAVHASMGQWSGVEVPGVTISEMLQRWEK